ncbi:MAG: hypothetical protein ACRDHH_02515 [Actinomycetota bacterium]
MSRWDPFRELSSIQSELNRLFGRTYGVEGDEALRARRFGAFARSITFPSSSDPEGIQVKATG